MKRLGCILLVLTLCLGAVACSAPDATPSDTTPADTTPVETTPTQTTPAETTPAPDPMLTLVSDGLCEYSVVRPEEASAAIVKAAQDVQAQLSAVAQKRPRIQEDWV